MRNQRIIGDCYIHESSTIMDFAIIGKPFRPLLTGETDLCGKTKINKKVYVGYFSIIGSGTVIGPHSIIDDRITIESVVSSGKKNLFIYSAQVCNEVTIGSNNIIGGFIGERTTIGNNCRVFGKIIHSQLNPLNPWDDENSMEEGAKIGDNVFIGFNSVISGSIHIGRNSFICAGAILSKDVPEKHIVYGINKIIHFNDWKGELRNSNIFYD